MLSIDDLTKCAHEEDDKLSKLTNKTYNMIEKKSSQSPVDLSKVPGEGETFEN